MIRLAEPQLTAIREHGRASYGDEACGVMYGHLNSEVKVVVEVEPLFNSRGEERHRRFTVTADDYRRVEAKASERGWTVLGFYHSHPDHPARPSAYDLEHAFPFFSYVILSVEKGEPVELRSFVMAADRETFVEEEIESPEKE